MDEENRESTGRGVDIEELVDRVEILSFGWDENANSGGAVIRAGEDRVVKLAFRDSRIPDSENVIMPGGDDE